MASAQSKEECPGQLLSSGLDLRIYSFDAKSQKVLLILTKPTK
jgi:hypothetical protein